MPVTLYRAELNERLAVHWTGGAWRVPLADRHLAITAADGSPLGRIVCAGEADLTRALAGIVPQPAPDPVEIAAAMAPFAALLAEVRALEDAPRDLWTPDLSARAAPPRGPVALFSAAALPVADLVAHLVLAAARGAVWKPAPAAAASGHLVMRALAPLLGRGVALVQGDHATGALLAARAPVHWLGAGPLPAALSDAARVPFRR